MKIFRLVMVLALSLSGYLGYSNFVEVDMSAVTEILAPTSMEEAEDMARERLNSSEEKSDDYVDLAMKIGEVLLPLLAPVIAARKRKNKKGEVVTVDDSIGALAENLGVSRAFVRGKLGLGDRRKKQNGTTKKRRVTDKKSRTQNR